MGGNKRYADRFQSLCIKNGYSCTLSSQSGMGFNLIEKSERDYPLQYLAYVKKVTSRSVSGVNVKDGSFQGEKAYKRARINVCLPDEGESVWCVETDYGTIVTRRNGKVVIMGNCGRAIRPYNNEDAWIVDACGNLGVFGRIEDLRVEFDSKNDLPMITGSGGRILTGVPLKEQEFFQGETLK